MLNGGGLVTKLCPTLATPWSVAHQAPLSMDSPGKDTGMGCHFLCWTEGGKNSSQNFEKIIFHTQVLQRVQVLKEPNSAIFSRRYFTLNVKAYSKYNKPSNTITY